MIPRGAQVEGDIGSLDLLTLEDTPHLWRPACERLRAALVEALHWQRRLAPLGVTSAAIAFALFEGPRLTQAQWVPLSVFAASIAAIWLVRNRSAEVIAGFAGMLSLFSMVTHTQFGGYVFLAMAVRWGVDWLLARRQPALHHEDRIEALLAYFGLQRAREAPKPEYAEDPAP